MLHETIDRSAMRRAPNYLLRMVVSGGSPFVQNYRCLPVGHAPALQILQLSQSITVFGALSCPLPRWGSLWFETRLRLIGRVRPTSTHGCLAQGHRVAVPMVDPASLIRRRSHQYRWIIQWSRMIGWGLSTQIACILEHLLLLLLDLLLDLQLL